jgi:chromosome segregation ATPase
MSNPTNSAGGANGSTGAGGAGESGTNQTDITNAGQATDDKPVSRESYLRAMDQLKAEQRARKELEAKLAEQARKDQDEIEKHLMKSGEVQKLIQLKDEKIDTLSKKTMELESNYNGLKSELTSAAKLQAVVSRLPGQLEHPAYMSFIDVDKIILNPETNEIESDSVDAVVNDFVKNHGKLLKTDTRTLPNGTPRTAGPKLSYSEWLRLPPKEQRARLKDVEGFKSSR